MLPLVKCSGGYHTTLDEHDQRDPIQKQVNWKFKEFSTAEEKFLNLRIQNACKEIMKIL